MIDTAQNKSQGGQILLIVLLSMAVVLTLVLSVLSRSITDVAITSKEQESLRAFSAAEAGVEESLLNGTVGIFQSSIGENSSYRAEVSAVGEGGSSFIYPKEMVANETATIWFVAHNDNGSLECLPTKPCFTGNQLKVCWGKAGADPNSATTPAIEASIVYAATPGDYGTVRIGRETADPNNSRRSTNSFSAPDAGSCTINNQGFAFQKIINLTALGVPVASQDTQNGLQYAKIKVFYNSDTGNSAPLAVDMNFSGNSILPSQGLKIESTGTTTDATRKVQVYKLFSETPTAFDSAVFSLNGITK